MIDYNYAFKWCVGVLEVYAKELDMTYEELNIWIFCIIEPLAFVVLLFLLLIALLKIQSLKTRLK